LDFIASFCSTQNYLGKITVNNQITYVKFQTAREYNKKLNFNPKPTPYSHIFVSQCFLTKMLFIVAKVSINGTTRMQKRAKTLFVDEVSSCLVLIE